MTGWFFGGVAFLGGVATGIVLCLIVMVVLWHWFTRPLRSIPDGDEPYGGA